MGSLFGGGVEAPPKPKPVRMPTTEDPNAQAAQARLREQQRLRKGRQSTILSDSLADTVGSSGTKLGA